MTSQSTAIDVDSLARIPRREIAFATSRSSGPGGQKVNKVETRVTLLFDLEASESLTPEQKETIGRRLASRISQEGVLRVTSQRHRTQARNRRAAEERFVELLAGALRPAPVRRPTRPTEASRRRRLDAKRQRSQRKAQRRRVDPE